jgi:spore photoproduct lyase
MIELERFPEKIFIEENCLNFPLTKSILKSLSQVPVEVVCDTGSLLEEFIAVPDPVGEGKKNLFITQQRGAFVKPCPCTPDYLGCNYTIINLDLNCPLDCSYCILQDYLTNPLVTIHVNTDKLWAQLDAFLSEKRGKYFRIGTGELGDSLALDSITGHSRGLIAYFRKRPNALLELKTKTINIKNILDTDPAENVVIAWSLNAKYIAQLEERGAPSVEERIEAARVLVKRGYRVAFHFDPIIRFPDWADGYAEIVEELFSRIPSSRIAWISLGSLRFPPQLKLIIHQRFPESAILYEEFVRGKDGKLRYFRPLRTELYRKMVSLIEQNQRARVPVYFCMESGDMWKGVLKNEPKGREDVEVLLSLPFVKGQ